MTMRPYALFAVALSTIALAAEPTLARNGARRWSTFPRPEVAGDRGDWDAKTAVVSPDLK